MSSPKPGVAYNAAMSLPYLSGDLAGIGGVIRQQPDDFFVQELPLYQPLGEGEHVYCEIEKTGLTTFDAVDRIARVLDVHPRDIGFAGMKDAHAVTRQILSIPNVQEQAVLDIRMPNLSVQWAKRHNNKLRLGHLAGNRFVIRIRQTAASDMEKAQAVLDLLQQRGKPNYFGEQRFGRRMNNHLLGAALIRGDDMGVLKLLLGDPMTDVDDAQAMGARKAFDRGEYEQAMHLFPRRSGMERRILARFIKKQNPTAAAKAIDDKLRRLWISALQSEMFNQVVARRLGSLHRLMAGDLAYLHASGAVFHVENLEVEQPRCDAFEISPSGPLVGYRVTLPEGEPLTIEQDAFAAFGMAPADFRVEGRHKIKGARRPLRIKPAEVQVSSGSDAMGSFLSLGFTLPAGAFATSLLREVMKNEEN
jgi:tRNA pseudouridine13 synthase